MAYNFAAKARFKAMNEKKVSKKTQNDMFNAYKVMRAKADGAKALERGREDSISQDNQVESVPTEDSQD